MYADDTVLLAESPENLQTLLNSLQVTLNNGASQLIR